MTGPQPTSVSHEPARYAPPAPQAVTPAASTLLDSFSYDDDIVRKFLIATFVWGLVGMLVGLVDRAAARQPGAERRAVAHVRPPAPAAHERGDLRVRRQRVLHRRLLLDPAAAQGADVLGPAEPLSLLGLAG